MTNPVITLGPAVLAGSTPAITGQFVDAFGNPINPTAMTACTVIVCDTITRQVIAASTSILNTGRGVIDSQGNLTLSLLATDTVKLGRYVTEMRSLVIDWTFNGGASVGKVEIQIPIQQSSPG